MMIEVTQCGMCKHYSEEQYCEIWQQYIANDSFYCACGAKADRKTEPQPENLFTDKYGDVWEWRGDAWYCISGQTEPQTEDEILREQCRAFMGIVEQTERSSE